MSAFATPLAKEVGELRATRVNALPSTVAERAAALRWRLERADMNHCDGFTTDDTPGLEADVPVEVKAVRVEHHDGIGRLSVYPDTHAQLADAGGIYAVVLYAEVDVDGERRIVALAAEIVDTDTMSRQLPNGASGYQKVRWDRILSCEVDRSRWCR